MNFDDEYESLNDLNDLETPNSEKLSTKKQEDMQFFTNVLNIMVLYYKVKIENIDVENFQFEASGKPQLPPTMTI